MDSECSVNLRAGHFKPPWRRLSVGPFPQQWWGGPPGPRPTPSSACTVRPGAALYPLKGGVCGESADEIRDWISLNATVSQYPVCGNLENYLATAPGID